MGLPDAYDVLILAAVLNITVLVNLSVWMLFIGDEAECVEEREKRKYFRAEVHLLEGGQDYDIMG